jgi:haloalkane dehalogenase
VELLRTPDARFSGLPGWPYDPSFVVVGGIRIAYYDVGNPRSAPVLLLHGEPTWSYLYRTVLPPLVDAGHRVIAIDLVGFGRSDKPTSRTDYTYQEHTRWLESVVVDHLGLTDISLFCHDWVACSGCDWSPTTAIDSRVSPRQTPFFRLVSNHQEGTS